MVFCKNCGTVMKGVMSFSKDKKEKFYRCSKCYDETKHNLLRGDELDFGEVLHREYQRQEIMKL